MEVALNVRLFERYDFGTELMIDLQFDAKNFLQGCMISVFDTCEFQLDTDHLQQDVEREADSPFRST